MNVCFVRHDGDDDTEYLFECSDELCEKIYPGKRVVCDTKRGRAFGTLTSYPIVVQQGRSLFQLLMAAGAYLPLKRIVKIAEALPPAERERIAKEWLREKLGSDLPF